MTLAERQKLAGESARLVMPLELYGFFSDAIAWGSAISLDYVDRYGNKSTRKGVYPQGFLEFPGSISSPGAVYVWAYHTAHGKNEQYNVLRIGEAKRLATLMEAILDISGNAEFWVGPKPEEKVVSTFDQLLQLINAAADIPDKDQLVLDWVKKYQSSSTAPIAGPSTYIVHEAYKVYVGDIPLYFDEVTDAVVTSVREMISGAALPQILKDRITGIQIVEEDARGGPDVVAMNADGFITIFGDRQVDIGVIAHEAAHDFAISKWGDPIPAEDSDYQAAINSGEPPVSEYSKRNSSEDFSEAVGMYVQDPALLQKIAPLRFDVIQKLMTDKS